MLQTPGEGSSCGVAGALTWQPRGSRLEFIPWDYFTCIFLVNFLILRANLGMLGALGKARFLPWLPIKPICISYNSSPASVMHEQRRVTKIS
ncbi:hypothetical protein E2C01_080445 [Portunus trituberculatus]|uniref:Uncharacterized protein n=1 Tax=Portunus trituberculatus TaxID=210409 RepID=A0A5B7ITH0_PORTR|nr:hypothetical protein [Portunus trituberculatus]